MIQETGSFAKSMVSDLLAKLDGMDERAFQEKAIKECAATVYIGLHVYYVFRTSSPDLASFPFCHSGL